MPLTDTFIRKVKHSGNPAGDKHTDGQALYLHVKEAGKYWRMSYRFNGKQRLLALGVYPAVTLARARQLRDEARQLVSAGVDPMAVKRQEKSARVLAQSTTFESMARVSGQSRPRSYCQHTGKEHGLVGAERVPNPRRRAHY
jgi:hypothetical protein